jgi:hypothetical protein
LDLALVGNLVLTALEEGASGASASASAASVVVVREGDGMEGLSEDGAARLNVEGGDEMQRYSRADVDVGLFSVPSVHLPVVPPPTPLSPPLSYADVNDDAHGDEEGNAVVRPRPSGVGTRHALGMTSRWSLTSSIDEAEGVTEGKRNAKEKEKEKEKEKRKSFVAFVAAVAGGASSNADGGVGPGAGAGGGVGAGGLDVPGGSGENLMLSKDKDPKEKKRGRLASFISRLSYSGGANALVSPSVFSCSFFWFIHFLTLFTRYSIRGTSAPPTYANPNHATGVSNSNEDAHVDVDEISIPEPI